MKSLILLLFLFFSLLMRSIAQKPVIDSNAIVNWSTVSVHHPVKITDDGMYFAYTTSVHFQSDGTRLVLQKIDNIWQKQFPGTAQCSFTSDSKKAIIHYGDTLNFIELGTDKSKQVLHISSYKEPDRNKGKWIAYQLSNESNEMVLQNVITGMERRFASVLDYAFDRDGNTLAIRTSVKENDSVNETLQLLNLSNNELKNIWSSAPLSKNKTIGGFSFDSHGTQLVFVTSEKKDNKEVNQIWYYKNKLEKAIMKADDQSEGLILV